MSRALVVMCGLLGCGRVGFDARFVGEDAAPDAAAATSRRWIQRMPAVSPPRLVGVTLVPYRGQLVFYGSEPMNTPADDAMWAYANDTWALICDPCAPGPRAHHALAHDPIRDVLVMFGGSDDDGVTVMNSVWEYDGTWVERTFAAPPPALQYATLVWSPSHARMYLVGGGDASNQHTTTTYAYDGTAWTVAATGGPRSHSSSVGAVWDQRLDKLVVFASEASALHDDVWTWDGTSWEMLCDPCTGTSRRAVSMLYEPGLGTLLVGGYGNAGEISGTWQLQGRSLVLIDDAPPQRDSVGLAYDAARDTVVLFGGNGDACMSANCDETWEFVPN